MFLNFFSTRTFKDYADLITIKISMFQICSQRFGFILALTYVITCVILKFLLIYRHLYLLNMKCSDRYHLATRTNMTLAPVGNKSKHPTITKTHIPRPTTSTLSSPGQRLADREKAGQVERPVGPKIYCSPDADAVVSMALCELLEINTNVKITLN